MYGFAPICFLTLSDKSIIEEINLTGAVMLGTERQWLIDRAFSVFLDKTGQAIFLAYRRRLAQYPHSQECELVIYPPHQSPLIF